MQACSHSIRIILATAGCILFSCTTAPVDAQVHDTSADEYSREMLGKLRQTWITVDANNARLEDVIDAIDEAADVNLIVRWRKEHHPLEALGLARDTPVSFHMKKMPAEVVLQRALDEASEFEPATWQIRKGFIEVGTKSYLGLENAREARLHPVRDLAFEAPHFSDDIHYSNRLFQEHTYKVAATADRIVEQKGSGEVAMELLEAIIDTIDPRNWDFLQFESLPREARPDRLAQIRLTNGAFMIIAPDYVHREIVGYKNETPPAQIEHQELQIRSERATRDRPGVEVQVEHVGPSNSLPSTNAVFEHIRKTIEKTPLTVAFENTPAEKAIAQLSQMLNIEIVPRWSTSPYPNGIDPETLVTFKAEEMPAFQVLEAVLAQVASSGSESNWQVRNGYIELGDEDQLATPAAAYLRLYDVADLIIQIPDYDERRIHRDLFGLELVEEIVNIIEPDMWDWGQFDDEPIEEDDSLHQQRAVDTDVDAIDAQPRQVEQPYIPTRYRPRHRPAIIRYWQGKMIVNAPGFIHRQLAGFNEGVPGFGND